MGYRENLLLTELPWAQNFARTCTSKLPHHLDHDDLQSAGVLGYLAAASRYDDSRGASFRGYCSVRIRGAVLDELRRWDWAPRAVHHVSNRITRVTSELMEKLEREPTPAELAAAMGIGVSELSTYQTLVQPRHFVSFDQVSDNFWGEEYLALAERLPDLAAPRPDAAILATETRRLLYRCLVSLPKSQVIVIVLYYLQGISLREVAALLGVSPSRVSQVHHQALERLKQAWILAEKLN